MKKFVFYPEVKHITMPNNHSMREWKDFFKKLMDVDYFAPFHAIVAAYSFLAEEEFAVPSSVYGSLYYDLGIELCADDRFPAEDAAWETGFMAKGVSMVVHMAAMRDEHYGDMMKIVADLFNNNHYIEEYVPDETVLLAKKLLEEQEDPNKDDNFNLWVDTFGEVMVEDPTACEFILGYFLEAATASVCSIYGSLENEQYRELGKKMHRSKLVLNAAKVSGLLASGCSIYVKTALHNKSSWNAYVEGVKYLMSEDSLRCFIPFREQRVTEKLLAADSVFGLNEDVWVMLRNHAYDCFEEESWGYEGSTGMNRGKNNA